MMETKIKFTGHDREETAMYVNPDSWFGKTWLISIMMGNSPAFYVVEADTEQGALDEFTDSKYGHLIKCEPCEYCQKGEVDQCECVFAGNSDNSVDIADMTINPCGVTSIQFTVRPQ